MPDITATIERIENTIYISLLGDKCGEKKIWPSERENMCSYEHIEYLWTRRKKQREEQKK
jgi:hypothetical protein